MIAAGVAFVVLLAAGRGALAAPPVDGFAAWVDGVGPVVATLALLRLAALVAAGWVVLACAAARAARVAGALRLAVAVELALPARLRAGAAAVSFAGLALTAPPAGAQEGTATMTVLDDEPVAPPPPAPVPTPPPPAPPPPSPAEWVVAPGESFWSIAEELVADALGRPPSDREITPYWRRLVDANRDRLASGDPDVIFPGQSLALPPVV